MSDTFLELFGLSFDKDLKIVTLTKQAAKYGIKIGDRLISVEGIDIKKEQDILDVLNDTKKSINLLFQRGGFQFFVKVN